LQLLKQDNIKATFFCIGNRIAGNENIIKKIKEEGHIIGNHSYSHHFWFDIFSSKKMLDDLKKMDLETEKITGLVPKLFRPPYGVTNPNLKKAIIKGNYTPVGWSVRSMDTVIRNEKKLLDKIKRSLKPGAVFLFHDTSKTTVSILPEFIREVKNKGYHIIPLDKLLHLIPYA
jgi:peptidoglycan/xylan/chitin deacetylase (PgdA/CDA1 family)